MSARFILWFSVGLLLLGVALLTLLPVAPTAAPDEVRTPWAIPIAYGVMGLGAIGLCVLIALGTWQLHRKTEKEALIEQMQARGEGSAIALPRRLTPVRTES